MYRKFFAALKKMEQKNIVKNKKLLFSPHMHHMLKKKGYSKDILQIIEEGCELEDIFSLLQLLPYFQIHYLLHLFLHASNS